MIEVTSLKPQPRTSDNLSFNSLYKDNDGNTWLTNDNGNLVGYFTTRPSAYSVKFLTNSGMPGISLTPFFGTISFT